MSVLKVNSELQELAKTILDEGKSLDEWREVESSDYFQTPSFVGGGLMQTTNHLSLAIMPHLVRSIG